MSTQQYSLEQYWPTEPWLEVYREAMDESDRLTETGDGWGVGWDGGMVFDIQGLPVTERTVGDLPDEVVAALEDAFESISDDRAQELIESAPAAVREDAEARSGSPSEALLAEILETPLGEAPERTSEELESELPGIFVDLMDQLEENVVEGDTVYAFLDLYDGGCREVEILQSLEDRDHGFVISGDYGHWKDLVSADADVINLIMSGDMEVDGDMQKILQYSDAAVVLTEIAGETESRFLF
jgi:putative sterol carrier protein